MFSGANSNITDLDKFIYNFCVTWKDEDDYGIIQQTFEALLKTNHDPNQLCALTGEPLVHVCIEQGKIECLEGMVGSCQEYGFKLDLTIKEPNRSFTPLHTACLACDDEIVDFLLKSKQYNQQLINDAVNGITALGIITVMPQFHGGHFDFEKNQHIKNIKDSLLNRGAILSSAPPIQEIEEIDDFDGKAYRELFNQNTLHALPVIGRPSRAKFDAEMAMSLDRFNNPPLVYLAKEEDHYQDVKKFLDACTPEDIKRFINLPAAQTNNSPLLIATCWGDDRMVSLLLNNGANPDQENYVGLTARQAAEHMGRGHLFPSFHFQQGFNPHYNSNKSRSRAASFNPFTAKVDQKQDESKFSCSF